MLDDPPAKIFEVIRWFGERGKIFNVHFRNINGHKLDFMEAFLDEGDIDMPRALAAYRDVGYPYMLMPDHVPQIDGRDPSGSPSPITTATPGAARRAAATTVTAPQHRLTALTLTADLRCLGPDAQSLLASEAYTSSPALLASKAEIRHCPKCRQA